MIKIIIFEQHKNLEMEVRSTDLFDDLRGGESGVGGWAEGDDLPHEDAEAPDVRLGREEIVVETFGRHPPDGQSTLRLALVHQRVRDVARESKVGHFAHAVRRQQHVARRQIPMNNLLQK